MFCCLMKHRQVLKLYRPTLVTAVGSGHTGKKVGVKKEDSGCREEKGQQKGIPTVCCGGWHRGWVL
jgi:hypothetical protein